MTKKIARPAPEKAEAPSSLDALEAKVAAEERRGRADAAEKLLLAAIKSSPNSLRLFLGLARARELQGDYAGAHAACARAVVIHPNSDQARSRLQIFEEILGLEAESTASLKIMYDLKVRTLQGEENSPKAQVQAAELAEDLGKFGACERHLHAALRLDPNFCPALLQLGTLELWAGRAAQAEKLARHAQRLDRLDPEALTLAGAAAASRGRLQEGLESLNAALAAEPDYLLAQVWRGEVLLRLGRAQEALTELNKTVGRTDNALGPNVLHSLASLAVGRTQAAWSLVCVARRLPERLGKLADEILSGNPRRMERALRSVLKRLGGNRTGSCVWLTGSRGRMTLAAYQVSDVADRMETLQRVLYTQPPKRVLALLEARLKAGENPGWVNSFLGETRLWLGQYDEAERDFRKALAAVPDMRWTHVGLALASLMRGHADEALEHCRRAEESDAPRRSWLAARGEAFLRLGRPADAARDINEALSISSQRISAWFNLTLARLDEGKTGEATKLYGRLAGWVPQYLMRAAREAGVEPDGILSSPAPIVMRKVLNAGLELMRGNRSSWLHSYIETDGRLRAIHFVYTAPR